MNYLVLETHPAYAVLLDEEGRFLKAANLHYQVGDTVQNIVELRPPQPRRVHPPHRVARPAGLAACLCLAFFGYYQPNFVAYGTLRIQINPDVEMTLSRTDRVLGLEGLNADGLILIDGYDYRGKDRDTAAEELVERAIDMGYLSDGDTISITVNSGDAGWQSREEEELQARLEENYGETIVIQVGEAGSAPATEVVIPLPVETSAPAPTPPPTAAPTAGPATSTPVPMPEPTSRPTAAPFPTPVPTPVPTPTPVPASTPGGDTDYGPGGDGVTDYGPNNDGVTDYQESYDPYRDGDTDYDRRENILNGGRDEDDEDDEDEDDGGDDDGDDGDMEEDDDKR